MALNPTFASASVNPSQSIGSDASAPAQGALPTGMNSQGFPIGDALPNGYNVMGQQNTGFSGLGGQASQPMTPYASFGGGLDMGYVAPQEPVVPMIPNFNQSYYQSPQYQSYLNNLQNTVPTDDHRMMPFGGFGSGNIAGLQNQSYEDFLKNPNMGQPATQEVPDYKYVNPNPRIAYFEDKNNYGGDLNTQLKAIDDAGQADPQYTAYLKKFYADADSYRNAPFTGEFRDTMPSPPQDYVSYLNNQDLINKQNSMPYQPQYNLFGQPSQSSAQGAMLPDADRKEMNPDYVIPKYTTQDVQNAMKNPEFDSGYYQKANIIDDQGNPISAQARQQLIQPFYNQVEQSMQYGPQVPYQDPQATIGPTQTPIGLPQFTSPPLTTISPPSPQSLATPTPTGLPLSSVTATPTGTTPMATNPLSTYTTTPTANAIPAPNLNVTPGSASSGSFGQGAVLPNVTTTQQQITAAPSFYTDYLNQLATQGGQAAQNAQYVGAQPLQEQAFNLASQNVGNYQPTLQNAINLASSVGNTNLAQAIGDVGQANIARNLAPQATAGIVGSGQFGSKRGAQALGDVIANAELGLTAQQQQAMQQDMANRLSAAQQLGTLANSTQQLGLGDINALSTLGQQQQTIGQNQQLFPMQQLANQSALLRGYNIPTSVSASQTGPGQQGQFQTSPLQQLMSVGTLLGALAKPDASGKSAGGNLYGGLESLINKITGKFSSPTVNPSTNTTTSTSIGDVSSSIKTLPDGRPNPNYDAYADPNATDADRELQNLLNTTPNPDLDILDYSDNSSISDEFDYSGFRE